MRSSRRGLGITEAKWHANCEGVAHVLEQHGIPERERNEFLEPFERYCSEIVETP